MESIATFQEMLDSLPADQITEEVKTRLQYFYDIEVKRLKEYAGRAEKPSVTLLPFTRSGSQYIANFWVNDLSLPYKDQYNWHLQNTSQWLYAGCILVQDGRVISHH